MIEELRQSFFMSIPFSTEADCMLAGFGLFLASLLILRHEMRAWKALFLPALLGVILAAIDVGLGKPLIEPLKIFALACFLPAVTILVRRLGWVR